MFNELQEIGDFSSSETDEMERQISSWILKSKITFSWLDALYAHIGCYIQ